MHTQIKDTYIYVMGDIENHLIKFLIWKSQEAVIYPSREPTSLIC